MFIQKPADECSQRLFWNSPNCNQNTSSLMSEWFKNYNEIVFRIKRNKPTTWMDHQRIKLNEKKKTILKKSQTV